MSVTTWDRAKEVIVEIDARLRAFTDRAAIYYVEDDLVYYKISVVMISASLKQTAAVKIVLSKPSMMSPYWVSDRIAHQFMLNWIEKVKLERTYEELDVRMDYPPSYLKEILGE